ncbi:MAG: ferritin family protein [Phycisphaeraceae bacterium]|nr:ferritin family protein [Phycisphaeraceae bacterium]
MTQPCQTLEEVLDSAIVREEQAHAYYTELSETMEDPAMKQAFLEFAAEELQHKEKLEAVKRGEYGLVDNTLPIPRLAIAESVKEVTPTRNMDYAAALSLAMKREKAAYMLYLRLSAEAKSGPMAELFLALAQQEANHKLRFEIEYDDVILREN